MCGLKTFLTLVSALLPTMLWGLPFSPTERLQLFAQCAGRYSALATHEAFFDGQASEAAEERAKTFQTLVDAVMPDAISYGMPARQALSWQVDEKMVHLALMQRATFEADPRRVEPARIRVDASIAQCEQLLLGA